MNTHLKNSFSLLAFLFLLTSCGQGEFIFHESLYERQPKVLVVSPSPESALSLLTEVKLTFSEAIDQTSLHKDSLMISLLSDEPELQEGSYQVEGNGKEVVWRATQDLKPGLYQVMATEKIFSVERLPLNQNPGLSPTPFISQFEVLKEDAENIKDEGDLPIFHQEDGQVQIETNAEDVAAEEVSPTKNRPEFLLIEEFYYDAPGKDTDGVLFLKLFGEVGSQIGGYKIHFVNGADGRTTASITLPEQAKISEDQVYLIADGRTGSTNVSFVVGADLILNFDPQNGPDCVQLVTDQEELMDVLGYGEPLIGTAENGFSCFEKNPAQDVASGFYLRRKEFGIDTDDNSTDFEEAPAN